MGFLNLINGSFILCLGIILLLCGLIMIYVKQRFASYDRHLSEQSQLLKHIVSSIENNMAYNNRQSSQLASNIAIETARKISHGGNEINKIIVSDDEESESENNESDSESVDDESSENSNEEESDDVQHEKKMELLMAQKAQNKLTLDVLAGLPHNPSNSHSSNEDGDINLDIDNDIESDASSDDDSVSESDSDINIRIKNDGIKLVELDDPNLIIEKIEDNSNKVSSTVANQLSTSLQEELHVTKLDDSEQSSNETKKIVTTNLENSLEKNNLVHLKDMKKQQLQELCKERNLNVNGTRLELIKRLSE